MSTNYFSYLQSPLGPLLLAGDGNSLSLLGFPDGKASRRHETGWVEDDQKFQAAREQLQAYFAGELTRFSLTLAPCGTDFQLRVWQALRKIPYGQTRTYGEIAQGIGNPAASRAVGAANGKNPIPIIVPCHRVIGASGKLVGFGGGLDAKQTLLAIERRTLNPELDL